MKTSTLLIVFFLLSLDSLFSQNNCQPLFEKNFTYPFNTISTLTQSTTIAISDDNTTVIGGNFTVSGNPNLYYFYVTKIDSSGSIMWSKRYRNGKVIFLAKIRSTSDGGYIAAGSSHSNDLSSNGEGKAFLAKLNAAGDIEWSREYNKSNVYYASFEDVRPTNDGGYVASGGSGINETTDVFVVKTNNKGDVQWSKLFDLGTNDVSRGIISNGNKFVLTANATDSTGAYKGYLLQLSAAAGNLRWIKRYDISSPYGSYITFSEIFKSGNGYAFTAYEGYVDNPSQYVVYTDTKGKITRSFSILENGADKNTLHNEATFLPTKDQGFITSSYVDAQPVEGILTPMAYVNKFDVNGTLQWSKKFTDYDTNYYVARIKETENHGFIFAMKGNLENVLVLSTDSLGRTGGCKDEGLSVTVSTPRIHPVHTQNITESSPVVAATPLTITSTELNPSVNTFCYKACQSPHTLTAEMIEQSSISKVKIYPNPFTDIVHITFNACRGAYTLTVADIEGKELLRRQGETTEGINNLSLNLGHLSKGIYLLGIRTSNSMLIQRLVKL